MFWWTITSRDINVKIGISEEEQIQEKFNWKPFSIRWYRKKPAWRYFDSYYVDILPKKEGWEKYKSKEETHSNILDHVDNSKVIEL